MKIFLGTCFRGVLFSLVLLSLAGCFGVAKRLTEMAWMEHGKYDKAINEIPYRYVATAGPLRLWMENPDGVRSALKIETLRMPNQKDLEELMLTPEDMKEIKLRHLRVLRDFFGDQGMINLITFKHILGVNNTESFLLDARRRDEFPTVAEVLLREGLAIANPELIERANYEWLLRRQTEAQLAGRGVWKNLEPPNPFWRD